MRQFLFLLISVFSTLMLQGCKVVGNANVNGGANSSLPSSLAEQKEAEQISIDALDGQISSVDAKVDGVIKIRDAAINDAKAALAIFSTIETLNFFDRGHEIDGAESKRFAEYVDAKKHAADQIVAADLDKTAKELADALATAKAEGLKFTDSIEVQGRVQQIEASQTLFKKQREEINKAAQDLDTKEADIYAKIDDAAKHFGAHLGNRIADLDAAIANAANANSLADIDAVLADPNFFSLKAEVTAEPLNGQNFTDALVKVENTLGDKVTLGLMKNAKDSLKIIDTLVDPRSRALTTQNEVDKIARQLDAILEDPTQPCETHAKSKGVTFGPAVRWAEIEKALSRTGRGPPGGIKLDLNQFNSGTLGLKLADVINQATVMNPAGVFQKAFASTIAGRPRFTYIDDAVLDAIRDHATLATNPATHRIDPKPAMDFTQKFLLSEIKKVLNDGDPSATNDDALLDNNLKKIELYIHDDLSKSIAKKIEDIKKKRAHFIAEKIEKRPIVKKIHKELDRFTAPNVDAKAAVEKCIEIVKANLLAGITDDPTIGNPSTCQAIEKKYADQDASLVPTPLRISPPVASALPPSWLGNPAETAKVMARLAKEAKELIGKDFYAALKKLDAAMSENEAQDAIVTLNASLDISRHITSIDSTYSYTVASLIDEAIDILKTKPIGPLKFSYEASVNLFWNELGPALSHAELEALGNRIEKRSGDPLEQFSFAIDVGNNYVDIRNLLKPVGGDRLLSAVRDAVKVRLLDASGLPIGAPDLNDALDAVKNAMDETSSKLAVKNLQRFVKEGPSPNDYKTQLKILRKRSFANRSFSDQRDELKVIVEATPQYKALKTLADIANVRNAHVELDAKKAPIVSLNELAGALPLSLRTSLFGRAIGDTDLKVEFDQVKYYLTQTLISLKAKSPRDATALKDENSFRPMVNAFNFIFAFLINEFNTLAFDGSANDDAENFDAFCAH